MNRINNNNNTINIQKYYQILQTLGIDKDVSQREFIIIQTEIVNEATRALGTSSFDEAYKKAEMACEAGNISLKWKLVEKNKNLSINRYYQELGLSENITIEEALRIQTKLSYEFVEASMKIGTKNDLIFGKVSAKVQKVNEIVNVLIEEVKNNNQIEAQKELNDILHREGMANSEDANKKVLEVVRRVALTDEEAVRKVDEIRKNEGCIGCHQEQNKNNPDNKPLVSTSNQKTSELKKQPDDKLKKSSNEQIIHKKTKNNNQDTDEQPTDDNLSTQKVNRPTDKTTLIVQLKAEIAQLKKNLDTNNAEQKAVLAAKEAQLAKLEGKTFANDKVNPPKNNLISVILPIGIVLVLLSAVFTVWRVKSKKFKV